VLDAAPDVKIVAMADAFKDILDYSHTELTKTYGNRVDVPAERRFVGLDAYKQLLATDINYVILAAPPGFRPQHLRAAVDAGKHIFTEKPVAVDATGVRECLAITKRR
jgi:predicted dehydrogenase